MMKLWRVFRVPPGTSHPEPGWAPFAGHVGDFTSEEEAIHNAQDGDMIEPIEWNESLGDDHINSPPVFKNAGPIFEVSETEVGEDDG